MVSQLQTLQMSDNFRVAECLSLPSQLFSYLTGNYICIREVVTHDLRPTFIELENYSFSQSLTERYIALVSYPNTLVLAQRSANRDIILYYYSQVDAQIRVHSQLARRTQNEIQLKYQLHRSQNYMYIVIKRETDVQIVIVSYSQRQVVGRGFACGEAEEFRIKNSQGLEQFSIFFGDSQQITEFQLIPYKHDDYSLKIIQKNHWDIKWKDAIHCWTKDELVVVNENNLHISVEGKDVQVIKNVGRVKLLNSTASGFIAVTSSNILFYKKNSSVFDLKHDFSLSFIPTANVQLSPQQDLFAFYCQKSKSIHYAINFDSAQNLKKYKRTHELTLQSIRSQRQRDFAINTYPSAQSMFVVSSGSLINVFSQSSFQCYLTTKATAIEAKLTESKRLLRSTSLISDKMLTQFNDGQSIQTVGIHPVQSVIAVAFKSLVRVYNVLYNQIKMLKEIQVSHCKQIGYNNSGNILWIKIGGKQGNKIYLYNSLQSYQCIQVLSTNRPVEYLKWSPLDNIIYAFHKSGFYLWNIDTMFKQRQESTVNINFSIKGAEIYHNRVVVYGDREILQIQNNFVIETIKTDKIIESLIIQNGTVIFTTAHGELFRCKVLNQINQVIGGKGFKINSGVKLIPVKLGTLLCLGKDGDIFCLEWGPEEKSSLEIVGIEKRKILKYQNDYKKYEESIIDLQEQLSTQIQILKQQFSKREQQQQRIFLSELRDREERYVSIRGQKLKIEQTMQQNLQAHEHQALQQIKELERIYQRKIAITTNKLLTSEQMGFRNQMLAKQNLEGLEEKHYEGIVAVRNQYGKALQKQLQENDKRQEIYALKKEYETKLSQLEQQNQNLLRRFQNMTENNITTLKKNVVNLELKYNQAISQKYNLAKEFEDERVQLDVVKSKNQYLEGRLHEQIRRGEQLTKEYNRIQDLIINKDGTIVSLEKRIQQLQKSNQIFKYRIIQMKNANDPKEEEILKLKDNMVQLQSEYQKITKKAHQHEQFISLLKKDVAQLKQNLNASQVKERKLDKNYGMVMDKLREATKAPIQEVRKMLMKILDNFENTAELKAQQEQKRSNSPLGQLNRVREHLEVCLMEAVDTGKKNQKQKNIQISRKNRQNSELLREINDLRIRVRELQTKLKDQQLQLQQFERQSRQFTSSLKGKKQERPSTHFQSETRDLQKNKTRESFFQKSMFKGHWREKRLKTEQGSRRKKSSHSLMKQQTNSNQLYIESKTEQAEQLRRILQQKQTIIKQLINKIHKLS